MVMIGVKEVGHALTVKQGCNSTTFLAIVWFIRRYNLADTVYTVID